MEHKHKNNLKTGHCSQCGIKMVGHLTLERHNEIAEQNEAAWAERCAESAKEIKNASVN